MGYCIKRKEDLGDAFSRIAAEEIAATMAELRRHDQGEGIHNARKALKRLRALLRSLRLAFPETWYRAENKRIARAGRRMSPLRDTQVQLRTLAGLGPDGPLSRRIRERLRRQQTAFCRKVPGLRRALRQMLSVSLNHFATRRPHAGAKELANGLKRIYRQGRAAFKTACKHPTPENLHEWRKKAKMLGYGFELIEGLGNDKTSKRLKCAERLSEALGDDHDLFMVEKALERENRARPAPDYRLLSKRIRSLRAGLQQKAFKLGARFYAEKPGHFRKRLGRRIRRNGRIH